MNALMIDAGASPRRSSTSAFSQIGGKGSVAATKGSSLQPDKPSKQQQQQHHQTCQTQLNGKPMTTSGITMRVSASQPTHQSASSTQRIRISSGGSVPLSSLPPSSQADMNSPRLPISPISTCRESLAVLTPEEEAERFQLEAEQSHDEEQVSISDDTLDDSSRASLSDRIEAGKDEAIRSWAATQTAVIPPCSE